MVNSTKLKVKPAPDHLDTDPASNKVNPFASNTVASDAVKYEMAKTTPKITIPNNVFFNVAGFFIKLNKERTIATKTTAISKKKAKSTIKFTALVISGVFLSAIETITNPANPITAIIATTIFNTLLFIEYYFLYLANKSIKEIEASSIVLTILSTLEII